MWRLAKPATFGARPVVSDQERAERIRRLRRGACRAIAVPGTRSSRNGEGHTSEGGLGTQVRRRGRCSVRIDHHVGSRCTRPDELRDRSRRPHGHPPVDSHLARHAHVARRGRGRARGRRQSRCLKITDCPRCRSRSRRAAPAKVTTGKAGTGPAAAGVAFRHDARPHRPRRSRNQRRTSHRRATDTPHDANHPTTVPRSAIPRRSVSRPMYA